MHTPDHAHFMRRAIELAGQNPRFPFGAVLVEISTGRIVAEGVNQGHQNPTYHGEMAAIHQFVAQGAPAAWNGLRLYTTAEPCCMCQGAILWAGIASVVFGTSIPGLTRLGWNQIDIPAAEVIRRAPFATCELIGGILEAECDALFAAALHLS